MTVKVLKVIFAVVMLVPLLVLLVAACWIVIALDRVNSWFGMRKAERHWKDLQRRDLDLEAKGCVAIKEEN